MKLTESETEEPVLSPDSPHPPCSLRLSVCRDGGQQGFRDLDVERGFADPRDAPTMAPGRWRQQHCHRSPSAEDVSLDCKKLNERRNDIMTAQSASVCLCVAVFWLGAVMVPVYTFWYLSYVRDASVVPLLPETVDRDIVDLSLFTRVRNASDPPLLARRERSDLSSQSATAAPTDNVDKTRRYPTASHRGYAVSRRFNTRARTYDRPRATSHRSVGVARRFTAPGASPWDSFMTKPVTAASATKLPSLAVNVSSRRSSLGPMAADVMTTSPIRWRLPVNDVRDLTTQRPNAKRATTQPSGTTGNALLASQRDTHGTRLPESPAAKTVVSLDSWTSGSFPETTGTSSWTKMAFHESTGSAPAAESRGLDHAHTVGSTTTGGMVTRAVIYESPHAHKTGLQDSTSAASFNDLTFTEGPSENESMSSARLAIVERDGTVSDGISSTEVPYVVFGGRRRKGAKPGGMTDEHSHGEFEYDEDGDNDETLPARLKGHRTVIVRDSHRFTEQAATGRKIWKLRFTATMRRNTV